MALTTGHNRSYKWLLTAATGGLLLFYFLVNPSDYSWVPQCVFHKVTGLQCMGCGAQRMIHALLHGDFAGAFHANAFLLISLPFLGFMVFVEFNRKRYSSLYSRLHTLPVIITISSLLLIWLIVRNFLGV